MVRIAYTVHCLLIIGIFHNLSVWSVQMVRYLTQTIKSVSQKFIISWLCSQELIGWQMMAILLGFYLRDYQFWLSIRRLECIAIALNCSHTMMILHAYIASSSSILIQKNAQLLQNILVMIKMLDSMWYPNKTNKWIQNPRTT